MASIESIEIGNESSIFIINQRKNEISISVGVLAAKIKMESNVPDKLLVKAEKVLNV